MNRFALISLLVLSSCRETAVKEYDERYEDQLLLNGLRGKCKDDSSCYIRQARQDFDSGKLFLFFNGLMDAKSFSDFYITCLESNKDINIIGAGDVADYNLKRYNYEMLNNILERFGTKYFDSCKANAERLSGTKSYRYW